MRRWQAVLLGGVFLATSLAVLNPAAAQPPDYTLSPVVVTASRTEEKLREVNAAMTVIDERQIRNSTADNMAQLLTQNGFQVINQGTSKILRIRGMGQNSMSTEMNSNVLVLLNGRRTGSNNVGLLGLDNIERVEIIRGPSAVQYGPSAMGGVVNIITKRGQEGFTAALEAGLGSFDLHKESLSLSGAGGGLDFSAGFSNLGRDDYSIRNDRRWEHTAIGSQTSLNMDLGYTFLENHRLGANFNYADTNDAESPGSGWSNTGAIGANSDYGNYDLRNSNLALNYQGTTSDRRFNWSTVYSFGRDKDKGDHYDSTNGDSQNDTTIDNKAFTAQGGYDGDLWSLTLGFDYLKYDMTQRGTWFASPVENDYEDIAGFVSAKLRLLDGKLIPSVGARYDDYKLDSDTPASDRSDRHFNPSLGLAWLPLEWLKVRANYSKGFKMPSPDQIGGNAWYLPNPGLNPEKSETYEAGIDLTWSFLTTGLTYFHTDWKDKIIGISVVPPFVNQFQNLKSVTIAGLEYALSADIGQAAGWSFGLRPYLNLTWLTTRKNKDPQEIATVGSDTLINTPKYLAVYGVEFTHPGSALTANLNAVYYGSILTGDRRAGKPGTNYVKTSDGTVVNFSLEKRLLDFKEMGALNLRLEVNNLFDDKNEPYLDYPDPGRNFYAGLRYVF